MTFVVAYSRSVPWTVGEAFDEGILLRNAVFMPPTTKPLVFS